MRYTALEKLNLFLTIYGRMFFAVFRPRTWFPFFLLALFQAAGLLVLINFHVGGLYSIVYPILSSFIPQAMFHYPQYYIAVPWVFSGFDNFVLGPTVWVILSAVAVYKLGGYYSGEKLSLKRGFTTAFNSYFPLLIFWAVETVLILLVLLAPTLVPSGLVEGSPRRRLALNLGVQMVAFGFSAFLVYTIPGIIIGKKRLTVAIHDSIKLCYHNFLLTFFIISIPGLLIMIQDMILNEFSPRIVKYLNPELIVLMLLFHIVFGIFLNLFIYGSAVFVYREMT